MLVEDVDSNMRFYMERVRCTQQEMGSIEKIGYLIGPYGGPSKDIPCDEFVNESEYVGDDDPSDQVSGPRAYPIDDLQ
jgi:hypothetical protein